MATYRAVHVDLDETPAWGVEVSVAGRQPELISFYPTEEEARARAEHMAALDRSSGHE